MIWHQLIGVSKIFYINSLLEFDSNRKIRQSSKKSEVRILFADANPILCQTMQTVIYNAVKAEVQTVCNGEDALNLFSKDKHDLVIIGDMLPNMNGLDILKEIRARTNSHPVLVYSNSSDSHCVYNAFKSGANGYLLKWHDVSEISRAVCTLLDGRQYVDPLLMGTLVLQFIGDYVRAPHECLSPEEKKVMVMIANGKCIKEIARTLGKSISTINTQYYKILQKMKMQNKTEITIYAIHYGLIK